VENLTMPNFPSVIPQVQFIDLISQYGLKFDHRVTFDGACSTGSAGIITSATINFQPADIGKRIVLTGAGASGAQYAGTISSLNSTTSANVTPNISTTVSSVGLQVHTDDLPGWTSFITDLNTNTTYYGAIISMRAAWTASGFTNRSGISSFLPAIQKPIYFQGIGGGHTADTGDYTKVGGTCIAYAGTSSAPTAFGAVMSFIPALGATAQSLKQVTLKNLWIDCRNGDQNEALKGFQFWSCTGADIADIFVMDPLGIGMEFLVVAPGVSVPNAGALGEAKDCTRNILENISFRCLDGPQAGTSTTATTTTSVITFSATGQSLTLAAAITNQPSAGYVWVMTSIGILVLVNFTGGGGTTTLTGCTVNAMDALYSYATVSGSAVVAATPGNACSMLLDGDGIATTGANTCLNQFNTVIIEQGSTYGPAGVEFRNSDSNLVSNLVINGGSVTVVNAINRVTRPGVRFNGHSSTASHARNNEIEGGSPGAGGCSAMALTSAGALLTEPSGPNYWNLQQFGNGEPIPSMERVTTSATQGAAGPFLDWNPNGGFRVGRIGPVSTTTQTISATTGLVAGCTTWDLPDQCFQLGTAIRWTIPVSKTAAGTAARTMAIHYGATGSTTDGVIATASITPTAAADQGVYIIDFVITALGTGTSGAALAYYYLLHESASAAGLGVNAGTMTMTGFNTNLPASGPTYLTVVIVTGTSEVLTINPPARVECISPGNP
jgi:hypothetical protein